MVLGEVIHYQIIYAHLWPKHTCGSEPEALELTREDINNFLRLHRDIEKAFDKKRFCHLLPLETEGVVVELIVHIISAELLQEN